MRHTHESIPFLPPSPLGESWKRSPELRFRDAALSQKNFGRPPLPTRGANSSVNFSASTSVHDTSVTISEKPPARQEPRAKKEDEASAAASTPATASESKRQTNIRPAAALTSKGSVRSQSPADGAPRPPKKTRAKLDREREKLKLSCR